jgi:uncharacterized membrane protein YebE (DUF533 family)
MKRVHSVLLMTALVSLIATAASAGTPRIDRREARQHARISQGVRSGELTRGEAMRLRAGQRHVYRMERRAKADGLVTRRERARITHAQNHQSRRIYRLKHNGRERA